MAHSEDSDEETVTELYAGYNENIMIHSADKAEDKKEAIKEDKQVAEDVKTTTPGEGEETIADVFETFNEKQKKVLYALVGMAQEDAGASDDDDDNKEDSEGGNKTMKHNAHRYSPLSPG